MRLGVWGIAWRARGERGLWGENGAGSNCRGGRRGADPGGVAGAMDLPWAVRLDSMASVAMLGAVLQDPPASEPHGATPAPPRAAAAVASALWATVAGLATYAGLLVARPEGLALAGVPYFARVVAVAAAVAFTAVLAAGLGRGRGEASLRLARRVLWPALALYVLLSVAFA